MLDRRLLKESLLKKGIGRSTGRGVVPKVRLGSRSYAMSGVPGMELEDTYRTETSHGGVRGGVQLPDLNMIPFSGIGTKYGPTALSYMPEINKLTNRGSGTVMGSSAYPRRRPWNV